MCHGTLRRARRREWKEMMVGVQSRPNRIVLAELAIVLLLAFALNFLVPMVKGLIRSATYTRTSQLQRL